MGTHIIIPARYRSSRFPGKPLAHLDGRPSITWTIEAARRIRGTTSIIVATDDARIAEVAENANAVVVMTSQECRNGTERVAEATVNLGLDDQDIVVNLQGDAPLTPPWFVEAIVSALAADPKADMVTPVLRCDVASYRNFTEDRRNGRVGATTVVFDRHRRALYFSKEVIPFLPADRQGDDVPVFHHVGVYAYRPSALREYRSLPIGLT